MGDVDTRIHRDIIKYMRTKTAKVKNGVITLPKELRKTWGEAEVYVSAGRDSIFIKKFARPSLSELRPKLKALGKRISEKEIEEAIREVRSKAR